MAKQASASCPSAVELEQYVSGAPTGDDVRRHVESCAACRTTVADMQANNALLSRLVDVRNAALSPSTSAAGGVGPGAALASDGIDGYQVVRELHRGGQGVVYEAVQTATSRTVALKVLLAGAFATSSQRRRFEREIEIVAGLEHPNIVTVFDSGVTAEGGHYFAMQFVDGRPIDDWIAARCEPGSPAPPPALVERLRLFAAVCAGVAHAHQHGVIHRDLKPANILVDEDGRPHILDFGLAKPVAPEDDDRARATVTVAGQFMGTLAYASPEQTTGDPGATDVRSDVYALGVILYEMLSGALPYDVTGDPASVLQSIRETPPRPLRDGRRNAATPRAVGVDGELETIVRKALAKEKERRYQSATALRDDIERYLAGEPVDAKRDSGWYVLRKTLRRYRVRVGVATSFVALLVVFSITLLVMYQHARTEADKVKQINLFLEDTLGSVEPLRPGEAVTVRELVNEAVQWIDIALSDRPEVAAAVRTTAANSYRNLGLHEDAERQVAISLDIRRSLFGDEHEQVAASLNVLAMIRRDQGRLDEAEQLFRDVLDMRRRLLGEWHYDVSLSYANLALLRLRRGDLDEAEALLGKSLDVRRQLFGVDHADVAMCLYNFARVKIARGESSAAIILHEQALTIRRRVLDPQHPDVARSLESLAALHLDAGDAERALPLLEECRALREAGLPEGHWLRADTAALLGRCLAQLGRHEEAESLLVPAVAALAALRGVDDAHTQRARAWTAELYEAWGREAEAARYRTEEP